MLILIMGLPGAGKTTFARALAEKTGAVHLNSDIVRRNIGKRGAYTPADKQAVYEELFRRTEASLQQGRDVIVDSTFYKASIRKPYEQLAEKYDHPLKLIVVKADEAVLQERLAQPRPDSEADFSVYQKIKAEYEPPDESLLVLWSDRLSMAEMLQKAEGALAG